MDFGQGLRISCGNRGLFISAGIRLFCSKGERESVGEDWYSF